MLALTKPAVYCKRYIFFYSTDGVFTFSDFKFYHVLEQALQAQVRHIKKLNDNLLVQK